MLKKALDFSRVALDPWSKNLGVFCESSLAAAFTAIGITMSLVALLVELGPNIDAKREKLFSIGSKLGFLPELSDAFYVLF